MVNVIQWNPSIAATVGEWHFGCYTEVAVVEGLHSIRKFNRDQGCWPLYRRWPLLRGDRYEGFHCIPILSPSLTYMKYGMFYNFLFVPYFAKKGKSIFPVVS